MQKHNTSVKKISIQSNQYLNDTLKNIPTGCTLIQGGTGIGKTTFVLNTLTKNHRVVMLVPSRGQVNQLAQEYKNHQNMVFISGDTKKDEDLSQYQKHHIVATYDQFIHLRGFFAQMAMD
jgi:ERCC4-related helicase